jgi:hypothetical protein
MKSKRDPANPGDVVMLSKRQVEEICNATLKAALSIKDSNPTVAWELVKKVVILQELKC